MPDRCVEVAHRSYSSDREFDECQYRSFALTAGLVRPQLGMAAAIGSAVDEAVKLLVEDQAAGFNLDELVDRFASEYRSGKPNDKDYAKAARFLDLWGDRVAPVWLKVGVWGTEVILHWEVDDVPYHAHVDVVLDDGTVIDLKTSGSRLGETQADDSVQLTAYAAAMREVYGVIPPEVILDGLIDTNPPPDVKAWDATADKPWWDRKVSHRTHEQLDSWAREVARREFARRTAAASGIYQTNGRASAYLCAKCPVKPVCPSWVGWETEGSDTVAA